MISIGEILSRFNGVKESGNSQWQCQCPVHKDKTASLGVKLKENRVLINCFAGCSIEDILSATDLTFEDIMPDKRGEHHAPMNQVWNPYSVLKALKDDVLFVFLCARHMDQGKRLLDVDKNKLSEVTDRLRSAYGRCK